MSLYEARLYLGHDYSSGVRLSIGTLVGIIHKSELGYDWLLY